MKYSVLQRLLLTVISLLIGWTCIADNNTAADKEMQKIAKKFENVKGVESMILAKGQGLELIKLALNKEFGKKFMKGVTSIVIIDYGEASEQTCLEIRKSLDAFTSLLEEIDIEELKKTDKKKAPKDDKDQKSEYDEMRFARFFCKDIGESTLSDFVIAMEDQEDKMIMYMGGEIIME